jgi:hypothetical protein
MPGEGIRWLGFLLFSVPSQVRNPGSEILSQAMHFPLHIGERIFYNAPPLREAPKEYIGLDKKEASS